VLGASEATRIAGRTTSSHGPANSGQTSGRRSRAARVSTSVAATGGSWSTSRSTGRHSTSPNDRSTRSAAR
jgi:hypothetical protein